MKRNQQSLRGGIEDILFPMEVLNITQGDNVGTHLGTYATDNAGKDTGIDPLFAPVSMKLVATDDDHGNAVFFQSLKKVRFADGSIDYLTMMFIHDNYINDIKAVKVFDQGQEFGDEGTEGFATGNHSHMEFAKGKFTHMYDLNKFGVYHLPNNMPIEKACFMDGTKMKVGVADWKYTKDVPVKAKPKFKVGDWVGVKNGAKTYDGKSCDGVVKGKVYYTLDELKGNRAVLDIDGICTPFNVKDLFK